MKQFLVAEYGLAAAKFRSVHILAALILMKVEQARDEAVPENNSL